MTKKRKTKKHVPQHIYCETYMTNYYVSYGVPEKDFRDALDRIMDYRPKGVLMYGKTYWFTKTDKSIIWIWLRGKNISALAHECFHAVFYTLVSKGLELTDESQEAFAYQLQMLMRKIRTGK